MKPGRGLVDLELLALSPGQARALDLDLELEPVDLGGQRYEPAPDGKARLDVSRTTSGYALRLRYTTQLDGPCVRCLEPAALGLEIDAREIEQPSAGDEELRSPYVDDDGMLDLRRWANDAMVLALPAQPLCRADCAGLCAVCGESLNDADPSRHRHGGGGDPRMAKLKDLELE